VPPRGTVGKQTHPARGYRRGGGDPCDRGPACGSRGGGCAARTFRGFRRLSEVRLLPPDRVQGVCLDGPQHRGGRREEGSLGDPGGPVRSGPAVQERGPLLSG